MLSLLTGANQLLAFLLELVMLAAFGCWAFVAAPACDESRPTMPPLIAGEMHLTPAQQAARQGAYIAEIQDEDADKVIQMETDWMSMLLMPDIGATVTKFTFRPTQNEILDLVQPKNLKIGGGLLQDNVWEQDWRFQELRGKYYNYQITQRGPDQVQVVAKNSQRGEVLEVRVHPEDLGRVIGRAGRTAKALRTLVTALADGRKVRVDVVDTDF